MAKYRKWKKEQRNDQTSFCFFPSKFAAAGHGILFHKHDHKLQFSNKSSLLSWFTHTHTIINILKCSACAKKSYSLVNFFLEWSGKLCVYSFRMAKKTEVNAKSSERKRILLHKKCSMSCYKNHGTNPFIFIWTQNKRKMRTDFNCNVNSYECLGRYNATSFASIFIWRSSFYFVLFKAFLFTGFFLLLLFLILKCWCCIMKFSTCSNLWTSTDQFLTRWLVTRDCRRELRWKLRSRWATASATAHKKVM